MKTQNMKFKITGLLQGIPTEQDGVVENVITQLKNMVEGASPDIDEVVVDYTLIDIPVPDNVIEHDFRKK